MKLRFLLLAALSCAALRAATIDTTQQGATLSGSCGGSSYSVTTQITWHFDQTLMKLSWTIVHLNSGYVCSGGYGLRKNGVVFASYSGAQPFGPSGSGVTYNGGPIDVATGDVITSDFSTSYTIPAGCPSQFKEFWIDNREGTAVQKVRIAAFDGSAITQASGTVSINGAAPGTFFSNTGYVEIPIGSVGHFIVSGPYCGELKCYVMGGDGIWYEGPNNGDGDPPVAVETRLPDPPSTPPPTINNPTDASSITTPPNPGPAFPQRITDGGMTEDRWTKGILDVMKNMATSSQVSGLNSQTSAQADAYNAQRLNSIDANIATLTRNSNEERADRTASNARMDAIKNNTKAAADALKDDPTIAQKHFEQTADAAHHTDLNDSLVKGLASRMPNAPNVTLPTNQSTFSMSFTPPGLTESQTVSFDLSAYDTGINVFKLVVRAALTVAFFFLTVKTLRSAFSG